MASDSCSVCDTLEFSTSCSEFCPICDTLEFPTTPSREMDVTIFTGQEESNGGAVAEYRYSSLREALSTSC